MTSKDIFLQLGADTENIPVLQLLSQKGALSAQQIATHLSKPRPTIYSQLEKLLGFGLVRSSKGTRAKVFSIETPETFLSLIQQKAESLSTLSTQVLDLLSKNNTESPIPRISVHEGRDALQQVLFDFYRLKDIQTESIWPIAEMIKVFGEDYFKILNRTRIKNRIHTRAIWPVNGIVDVSSHPYMGSGKNFYRDIRIAPKGTTWNVGYWLYGDKATFVLSSQELFSFTIQSQGVVDLLRVLFEQLWQKSKPKEFNNKETDKFLNTL